MITIMLTSLLYTICTIRMMIGFESWCYKRFHAIRTTDILNSSEQISIYSIISISVIPIIYVYSISSHLNDFLLHTIIIFYDGSLDKSLIITQSYFVTS
jgi:hypothetical protein